MENKVAKSKYKYQNSINCIIFINNKEYFENFKKYIVGIFAKCYHILCKGKPTIKNLTKPLQGG